MSDQTNSERNEATATKAVSTSIELDFSNDTISEGQPPTLQVGGDYDPRPQEDGARRTIAFLLIGLLWLIVSGILILLGFKAITVTEVKEFGVVLGPIVTLVSAATGFYYGTKSNSAPASQK
jgi:hypothetical protein